MLATNADLAKKLDALEKKYDAQFRVVFDAIRDLMTPPAKPESEIALAEGAQIGCRVHRRSGPRIEPLPITQAELPHARDEPPPRRVVTTPSVQLGGGGSARGNSCVEEIDRIGQTRPRRAPNIKSPG
jgi:hypothetical protein